jgi:hypothetical protein
MTRSFEDDHMHTSGHRGFRLLSLAAGAVLAMALVALGTRDIDAATEPSWTDAPPATPPGTVEPGGAMTEQLAQRRDEGVDWTRVEVWSEFGPAAVAAYER